MKKTWLYRCCWLSVLPLAVISCTKKNDSVIKSGHLVLEVNDQMQTKVNADYPGATPLTAAFSTSESLKTAYFSTGGFTVKTVDTEAFRDQGGEGVAWAITGVSGQDSLEKILHIRVYRQFPDAVILGVQYVNKGKRVLPVIKWTNSAYQLEPSKDTVKFWSFQGASYQDRRDWIQPVNPGFHQENFMGMNASDYGGGIPVADLWRPDAGLMVGSVSPVARLVSLPVSYDPYAPGASLAVAYDYPFRKTLAPGDTLSTFETILSVHRKDCFDALRTYAGFMRTRGLVPAASEPAAFEPIWCAWGYERDFTVKEILRTLPKVKQLGIDWVGIDDGYQQDEGDWHTNRSHFPGGDAQMKALVDSIHSYGLKAVLWWAPLAVDPDSRFLREHPGILLIQKNGAPQYITWWNSFYMAPTDSVVLDNAKQTVKLFLDDWGFDALKLDGQHMNACAPDYGGHGLDNPDESYQRLPLFFREIFRTARSIKPHAVVEFCPCGECMNLYTMPYTNQFVASDPVSSWQVRLKGKVYKALMPRTAYFGDHVELTDNGQDFASQIGVGGVPGTKFVWPATGDSSKDANLLTPKKDTLFHKWISLYKKDMLSTGDYLGGLYDIGYDKPEAHCIRKDGKMYYAFFAPSYQGAVQLRGLADSLRYQVRDYFHDRSLGEVTAGAPEVHVSFHGFLMLEATPRP